MNQSISQHEVSSGESLYSIAQKYGTSVSGLLTVNPEITEDTILQPGQVILIPQGNLNKRGIDVNGFTLNISSATLNETLPVLTYISPFSYQVNAQGELSPLNDTSVIETARRNNVAPLMCITNIEEGGGFSSDITHAVLSDQDVKNAFIQNTIRAMDDRNYYGVILDFEYIYPSDRENYNQLLRQLSEELHSLGYIMATAIAPKISADQPGTLYEAHDYPVHGEVCDLVIIMTYEWGYTYGPAMAVAPIGPVRRVLEYAVSAIPANKILMGMPNYGYNWTLPFVQGSAARLLTNTGAVSLASQVGAEIMFDETQQAPFFHYYDDQRRRHEVWFEDARSMQARLRLVEEFNLAGVSFWTIDSMFRQGYLVMQSMYDINKVL